MEMNVSVKKLAEMAGGRIVSYANSGRTSDFRIKNLETMEDASGEDVTFLSNPKYLKSISATKAAVVLVAEDIFKSIPEDELKKSEKMFVLVKNPQLAVSRLLKENKTELHFKGVSERASISKKASIGKNVGIGDFCVVEDGAVVGDGSVIYAGTFVGKDTVIGRDCLIYPNVVLRERAVLGDRVIINNGAVVGSDGFGFVFENGVHEKIPQIGSVKIGSDVEIGANSAIDRGTIGETVIGDGTKIDNLVHIAHNVRIGKNCLIVALVGISGSTKIGDHVTMAGQAGVVGHVNIGNKVTIAARAGVINDVPDNSVVSGYPAKPHKEMMKIIAATYRLPKILKRLSKKERDDINEN